MNKTNILIIALSIFFFFGCENFFENVIEIDIPDHDPELVVYAAFDEDEDKFSLELYHSLGILDEYYNSIESPTIEVFNNGTKLPLDFVIDSTENHVSYYWNDSLQEFDMDTIYSKIFSANALPLSTGELELNIDVDGFTAVKSIIEKPEIDFSVDTLSFLEKGGTLYGETSAALNITMSGFDQDNFLIFSVIEIDTVFGHSNSFYPICNNPSFHTIDYINFGAFENSFIALDTRDIHSDQLSFKINCDIYNSGISNLKYYLKVRSISKELFDFLNGLNQYELSRDNPFSEPVSIPSNIENGFGVFGVSNTTLIEFKK